MQSHVPVGLDRCQHWPALLPELSFGEVVMKLIYVRGLRILDGEMNE